MSANPVEIAIAIEYENIDGGTLANLVEIFEEYHFELDHFKLWNMSQFDEIFGHFSASDLLRVILDSEINNYHTCFVIDDEFNVYSFRSLLDYFNFLETYRKEILDKILEYCVEDDMFTDAVGSCLEQAGFVVNTPRIEIEYV